MTPNAQSPETLDTVVAALSEKEAKEILLDLLYSYPKEGAKLMREKCEYRQEEIGNAYLSTLQNSLEDIIADLSASIEDDEMTPYWDELNLTYEGSYVDDMCQLFKEAADKMPIEDLLDLAVDTNESLMDQTVFDWHPDPTEGLGDFLVAIGSAKMKGASKEEQKRILELVEKKADEHLSEFEKTYILSKLKESRKAPK